MELLVADMTESLRPLTVHALLLAGASAALLTVYSRVRLHERVHGLVRELQRSNATPNYGPSRQPARARNGTLGGAIASVLLPPAELLGTDRSARTWSNGRRVGGAIVRWHVRNADLAISAREALVVWLSVSLSVGILGSALDVRLGGAAMAMVMGALPMWLLGRRRRGVQRFANALPQVLRNIAAELRAGGTITTALSQTTHAFAARSNHATIDDGERIAGQLANGVPAATALREWQRTRQCVELSVVCGTLMLADQVGGPSADAIEHVAQSLEMRQTVANETRAQSAQARASAMVMVGAPVGYLMFSASIDQRALDVLLGTWPGRVCAAVGLTLDGLAFVWIRHLVRDRVPT